MIKNVVKYNKTLVSLLGEFTNTGIKYCHWKSNEHLEKGIFGKTDLDILTQKVEEEKIQKLLIKNNFIKVKSHNWNTYKDVEDWIGYDYESGIQVHIHLHYRLITGKQNIKEYILPWSDIVLNNAILDNIYSIMICNPNIEFIILITRILLKRFNFFVIPNNKNTYNLSLPDKYEIEFLYKNTEEAKIKLFAIEMFNENIAEKILDLYANYPNWPNYLMKDLKLCIENHLIKYKLYSQFYINIISFYRYSLESLLRILKHPINKKKKLFSKGYFISFIGVDGSGKTTLAIDTVKWLSWKIDCRYIYLGTGKGKSSILNRLVRKYAELKHNNNYITTKNDNKCIINNINQNGLLYALRKTLLNFISLSNAKYKLKAIIHAQMLLNTGVIIITDRFPQNKFWGINDGPVIELTGNKFLDLINYAMQRKELAIFQKIKPPTNIIKLIIPLEVSRERKQDSPLELIRKKISIVNQLHYNQAVEHIINNNTHIEDAKTKVRKIIWEILTNS